MNSLNALTGSDVLALQAAQEAATGYLDRVEHTLQALLGEREGDTLVMAGRHLCFGGGAKRARPMLVRLFGAAVGAGEEPLVALGASAELIHSASLLHDDVVDAGMFRRGRPTVNALWGNTASVMAGDLLLATALRSLSALPPAVIYQAIDTVAEMTRAAILEVECRGDLSLPVERLRTIAEGKTGSLFAWCGTAAAEVMGDADAGPRFSSFGRRLGVAFQIADDVRDLTGSDQGKPQYADVQARNLSYPLLLAVQKDPALRRRLNAAWAFSAMTSERVAELGSAIVEADVIAPSVERIRAEVQGAVDALGPYGRTEGGAALIGWAQRLAESVQTQP